jgi:hypothetical protein
MHCVARLRSTYPVADNSISSFTNIHIFKEEITMNDFENYLFEALEQVQAWEISEEDIPAAANAQAHLMTGCCPDYYYDGVLSDYPSMR